MREIYGIMEIIVLTKGLYSGKKLVDTVNKQGYAYGNTARDVVSGGRRTLQCPR